MTVTDRAPITERMDEPPVEVLDTATPLDIFPVSQGPLPSS